MFLESLFILCSISIIVVHGDELVSAVIVFRHGARTPLKFHPRDPYQNISYWPVPPGELTEEGSIQAYELGKWVHKRYRNFLPDQYSSRDFFIVSSDMDRTLMSAAAFSAGLYTSTNQLPIQPIPIHSVPQASDNVVHMFADKCPNYDVLEKDLLGSTYFKNLNKQNEDLYAYISKFTGLNITSIVGLEKIYDTFYVEEFFNRSIPEWTREIYPNKLGNIAFLNMLLPSYTTKMARLGPGPLLKEIVTYFASFTNISALQDSYYSMAKSSGRKLFAISGHDSNIVGILHVLKIPNLSWTPFSSSILFELMKKPNEKLYLNIFYKKGSEIIRVASDRLDSNWDLNSFIEFLQPYLISRKQWEIECGL